MARRILIVEDNDGVAHLLEELARELGLEPVRARGGQEALAKLQPLPSMAIVDLVLSDLDGFQVATALRALPGGAALPLVVVSGVYRKLPDTFVEAVRPHFLPKPFDPSQLRTLVESVFGAADQAAGLARGRFVRSTPAELFVQLLEKRQTGLLEVVHGEVRRRLYVQAGQFRFGQSNVRAESAGGMQVASGALTVEAFERAVAHAKQARVPLHEALFLTGALTREGVQEALRAQTAEVAAGVLAMAGAEWTFLAMEPGKLAEKAPDAKRHPLSTILEAARRVPPGEAREALGRLGGGKLLKTPLLERELFLVRTVWPGETVTSLATGALVSELAQKARPEELPLALALVQAGLLAQEAPKAAAVSGGSALLAAPEDSDRGKRFTGEEEKARRLIFSERTRSEALNYYELFGVAPKAGLEEIRRGYLELARRYHTDGYSGLELGSARPVLEKLFQQVNEAMETLADDARRAEYDIYVQRRAAGLPTDVNAILRAETLFQRGEVLMRAGKFAEALALLQEAVSLNHAEPEFQAHLGYALFKVNGPESASVARAHIEKAIADSPNLASAYVLLGLLARDTGAGGDAERQFERALDHDPQNETAQRELRFLRHKRGKKEEGGKSLFSRLLGK